MTSASTRTAPTPPTVSRYRRLVLIALFIVITVVACNLGARALVTESTRKHTVEWLTHPGDAWANSWEPMLAALNWLELPQHGTLYKSVFFDEQIKFQYPPTSLLPFAAMERLGIPLTQNSLNGIGWVWILITALAMAAYGVILAERSGAAPTADLRARALVALTFVFATLTFFPVMVAFTIGQIQTWINGLFVFACLCWIYDRRLAAGMLIGAICLIKPQLGLFLVWGGLRRQWSFLAGWGLVVVPAVVVSVALFGLANNLDYLSVLRFLSDRGEYHHYNQSINGLLNRMLRLGDSLEFPFNFPPYHPLVYFGTLLSSLALTLCALFLRGRQSDRGGMFDFLTAALTFTIASPVAWMHHYGVLPPILAALLFALLAQPGQRGQRGVWVVLAIAYFLSANLIYAANFLADTPFNFVQSYLLLAGLATLWLLYRLKTPPAFDDPRLAALHGSAAGSRPADSLLV